MKPLLNTMEITFYRKNVYGKELMYVADQQAAQHLTNLTGKKTLDAGMKRTLEALGFTFKEVLAPNAA